MTALKLSILLVIAGHLSCAQETSSSNPERRRANPEAVVFNNKAMELVAFFDDKDSCKKALLLLEKATGIDSSYFLGHYNKLMFFYRLEQFDKALLTAKKLIQLEPNAHDMYMLNGILSEKQKDPISAKKYFEKSLEICNSVLDTMKKENRDYLMLVMNKALTMIMLDDEVAGHRILKELYDSQSDELWRGMISQYLDKTKKDLLAMMTSADYL
jgi:tetratricopeptide (TPR) repeat protein